MVIFKIGFGLLDFCDINWGTITSIMNNVLGNLHTRSHSASQLAKVRFSATFMRKSSAPP